ncbi:hypothetical protein [Kitasatospora sp. NPDC088351]|uniref:hypothetical protein n=1 Tax=Kitasatospora sp. NPDC088351 TaxID=3155180 RepID=UPI0034203F98
MRVKPKEARDGGPFRGCRVVPRHVAGTVHREELAEFIACDQEPARAAADLGFPVAAPV